MPDYYISCVFLYVCERDVDVGSVKKCTSYLAYEEEKCREGEGGRI